MSAPPSTEVQIALLIHGQALLQREIEETKREAEAAASDNAKKIAALEDERTKALKWGVMTLGTAVMGMVYWIFDHLPIMGPR